MQRFLGHEVHFYLQEDWIDVAEEIDDLFLGDAEVIQFLIMQHIKPSLVSLVSLVLDAPGHICSFLCS